MSVIIRLQNLPWSANALDIREFFKGLSIPEGGVHIVGGELGDAFIAFSTDEDARLAMQKSGSSLKGIQVTLLLSSRNEMQKVIEAARQQAMALQGFAPPPVIPTQQAPVSVPQSQPPPPLPQPSLPGLQHQQMGAHTPYQVHGRPGGVDGPDQLPPHLPPHMVPQPGQPMVQPGASMSLPPPTTTTAAPPPGPAMPGTLPPPSTKPSDTQASSSSSSSDKKDDKKSSSSSSSSRRDSKSRRRRTKSRSRTRSRSRDRDRRRRHRSRSRSRSRDRSSRSRRRSRSRDRDRGRDRTRDRDRDKDRSSRSGRDRSERGSLDKSEGPAAIIDLSKDTMPLGGGGDGIPGLGEIPSLKGPLPSSLAEPIKNSPIQTPSHSPSPAYTTLPFMPPPFQGGKMFGVPPGGPGPMGTGDMPLATKFNEPMETETVDDTPIVLEGLEAVADPRAMRGAMIGGPPRMDSKGGLLGDGPQGQPFGGFQGRGMPPFRGGDNFGFGGGQGGPPHSDGDYMDPRGSRSDSSRQRDPRDRGFRGDMDPRDSRRKDDDRGSRDDPNGWEGSGGGSSSGSSSKRERSSRWEAADKPEPQSEPPEWSGRGRREGWGDREEDKWGGRGDGWKDDGFGRRDDRDGYDDPYGYNYRGRGSRGMDRGRIGRGGRGFNPRFGSYPPGFSEENGEDGYAYRGSFRGRGGFRGGRGGTPFGFRDGGGEWGEETCSVELHNVPLGASYRAIRDMFHGIYVPKTGIKLLSDERGNRLDVALLQFSSPRDAQRALRCSGSYIFDNKIEVVLTSEANYEAAVDMNQMKMFPRGGGSGQSMPDAAWQDSNCVCVTGVPPGCSESDVAQLLSHYTVQDVVMEPEKGRCLVRLSTSEAARHAAATLTNTPDNPHLMVELCPPEALAATTRVRETAKGGSGSAGKEKKGEDKKATENGDEAARHQPVGADLLTDSVVMKGVPKDATEANIRDFFSDEGLVPERLHFCDADGDGTRQVYVIFPLIEDARKAVGKSQQQLCKVKVNVELIAKPLVMASLGIPFDPLELIRKGQKQGETPFPTKADGLGSSGDKEEAAKKEAAQTAEEEAKDLLAQEDLAGGMAMGQDLLQGYGAPGLMGQIPYRGAIMTQFPGGPRAFRPFMARMPMGMAGMRNPADAGFARMRGSVPLLRDPVDSPTGNGTESLGNAIPPEEFGKPGCVVSLGNVPYRATTEDILNFFRDFPQLRPENIIRRYNEFNQPTADARVSFRSPQEAQRAVQSLNRAYLSGRQVFLAMLQE